MKIRYNRLLASVMLGLGLICLLLNVWVGALVGFEGVLPGLLTGTIVSFVGVLYFNTPVLELSGDTLTTYRPLGLVHTRFPITNKAEIKIENGRILVGGRKLPTPRWMADKSDWDAFARAIAA